MVLIQLASNTTESNLLLKVWTPVRCFGFLILKMVLVMWTINFQTAQANEFIRPESYEDFPKALNQKHFFVPESSVAWADYEALRRDFPALLGLSNQRVDAWIIENFAFISEAQASLDKVRIEIPFLEANQTRVFTHPLGYGRASVARASLDPQNEDSASMGLVDLKGTGHSNRARVDEQIASYQRILKGNKSQQTELLNKLQIRDHSDGMMTLGEAIAEVTRQQAVQKGFELSRLKGREAWQTVESYFIISLPIKILKGHGTADGSAIYGRQAHWRGANIPEAPKEVYFDDFGGKQASVFKSAVDFGGVSVEVPELVETFGDSSQWGKIEKSSKLSQVKLANQPHFSGIDINAQLSNAWVYGHETANYYEESKKLNPIQARQAVEKHILTMLGPIETVLQRYSRLSEQQQMVDYLARTMPHNPFSDSAGIWRNKFRSLQIELQEAVRAALSYVDKVLFPDYVARPMCRYFYFR